MTARYSAVWIVLVGCYSPASTFTPCTVSCAQGAPCPGDLVCGSDFLCHAPGSDVCTTVEIDAAVDAAGPIAAVDLIAWDSSMVQVAASTGTSFKSPTTFLNTNYSGNDIHAVCDVDGDGRADLVNWNQPDVYVAISTGTSFAPATVWLSGFFDANIQLCGDVSGDGFADLVRNDGSGNITVALSNGGSFGSFAVWGPGAPSDAFSGTRANLIARLDLDARYDLIAWTDNSVNVKLSLPGNAFTTGVSWSSGATYGAVASLAGDVNGDGRADLIAWNANSVFVQLQGTQFDAPVRWSSATFVGTLANLAGDVNGDQLVDLIAWNADEIRVSLSTGAAFAPPTTWATVSLNATVKLAAANVDL